MNPMQERAVHAAEGPLLVLAGAGSGKTRVLVERLMRYLKSGVDPLSLLAVTFTNKAAREMRARVGRDLPWMGTFHGLGHRFLRLHYKEAGLTENFRILDSDDQNRLIKNIIQDLKWDKNRFDPKALAAFINRHKEEGQRADDVKVYSRESEYYQEFYSHYERACRRHSVIDFAEILLSVSDLWHAHPALLARYQDKFYALLVDEFQDTNMVQYRFIRQLAGNRSNIMVVGDDDQSIYGWRGAKIENIQQFTQDYPQADIIRLEQNYRSTSVILKAANALIEHNEKRLGKELWTETLGGSLLDLYPAVNELDEALYIANGLMDRHFSGVGYRDMAVLYRSHAQSRVIEQILGQKRIPYRVFGGVPFFERSEIKDIIAYLRLIVHEGDDLSFERIINTPSRGIGEKTLAQIKELAQEQSISCMDSLLQCAEESSAKKRLLFEGFLSLIRELRVEAETLYLPELLEKILLRCAFKGWLEQHYDRENAANKWENIQELITATEAFLNTQRQEAGGDIAPWEVLRHFLATLSLDTTETASKDQEGVSLMSVHSAKGLEFSAVFLVGLEEGLFPHHRSFSSPAALEEERRLCYVGMTRARHTLSLSYANHRSFAGRTSDSAPSRFIQEIPSALFEPSKKRVLVPEKKISRPDRAQGWEIGERVLHPRFGKGTIVDMAGDGALQTVRVRFVDPQWGLKNLILSYAQLEREDAESF